MADDLHNRLKAHEPMRPEENQHDKKTKGFKEKHRIPQYIVGRIYKLPLNDCARCEVEKIPQTDQTIRSFPNFRYFVEQFH